MTCRRMAAKEFVLCKLNNNGSYASSITGQKIVDVTASRFVEQQEISFCEDVYCA